MSDSQLSDEACPGRQEILHSIKVTVDHITALHNLEIDAISKGDMEEWEAIAHNLRKATDFRNSLVERYELHVEVHDCP